MSNGRWQKYPEDNRNYGFFPNDRNRYPPPNNNVNRYSFGRHYPPNDFITMQPLPQQHRMSGNSYSYASSSRYPRGNSDYYEKESNNKYKSRERSKDLRNSSTMTNFPDKIITENNEKPNLSTTEDTNKLVKDKLKLNSPRKSVNNNNNNNKRVSSGNVLSIEDAVKLSNSGKESGEQPEKKRKLSTNEEIDNNSSNENAFQTHLKDIQTCKKDLLAIKQKIKSKCVVIEKIKTQFNDEMDELKELQIKKKTLSRKVKKMCRALAEVDEEEKIEENSGDKKKNEEIAPPIDIAALNEITISLESNSESSGEESSSSSSSSVQFVNETVTINNDDDDDDDEGDNGNDSTDSSDSSPPPAPQQQQQSSNQSKTNNNNNSKIEYKLMSTDVGEEQSMKLNESALTNNNNQVTETTPTTTAAATNQIKSVTSSSSDKTEKKISIKETKNELVETTMKLENANKEITIDFPLNFKADTEFSLYNEIEPKLNTIVISDEEKTFIADIKIFNNRLFVGASHGLLRQYHLGTQECIKDYKGHAALVHCILPTVYPSGINRLISGGLDKILLIHDVDTGLVLNKVEEESSIFSLCDHLDFVYYGTVKGHVSAFSLEKNRKMSSFSASTSAISCLTATRDGNNHILFVGTNDGEYSMWDAITYTKLRVINPISHREIPIGFILLQKQRILAFSKNYVHFINYVKTKSSTIFNHFDPMVSICLTKNYIIIGAICGKISVYKVKSSTIQKIPIRTISNSSSPIISLTFYNNTIISGDKTGKVYFNRLVEDKSL